MSVLGEVIDKTGDLILRLWERGQNFFWAVGSAGTAAFLILLTGWWFDLGAREGNIVIEFREYQGNRN